MSAAGWRSDPSVREERCQERGRARRTAGAYPKGLPPPPRWPQASQAQPLPLSCPLSPGRLRLTVVLLCAALPYLSASTRPPSPFLCLCPNGGLRSAVLSQPSLSLFPPLPRVPATPPLLSSPPPSLSFPSYAACVARVRRGGRAVFTIRIPMTPSPHPTPLPPTPILFLFLPPPLALVLSLALWPWGPPSPVQSNTNTKTPL